MCSDYDITTGMLGVWLAKQEEIRAAVADKKRAALKLGSVRPPRFPKAEAELEVRFKERRRGGRRVTSRWLVTTMRQLGKEMYPGLKFVASYGWLHRCCHRLGIAMRTKSNCKGQAAQDRLPAVMQWLSKYRFMLSTPLNKSMTMHPVWGRFPPNHRFNCDQVPFVPSLICNRAVAAPASATCPSQPRGCSLICYLHRNRAVAATVPVTRNRAVAAPALRYLPTRSCVLGTTCICQ